MKKSLATLLMMSLAVGCGPDPATAQKLADLEAELAKVKEQAAKAPAARPGAAPINKEEEDAAGKLLKEANEAFMKMEFDTTRAKLAQLGEKYPKTRANRASKRILDELNVIGKDAGSMEVEKWYQGNADLGAGKATMLVFWEVWCPHCKREVPKIDGTFQKYKDQGFQVVGLTKQTREVSDDQVASFIKDNNVSYPIGKESGMAMSQRYGVKGIPAAAVVKDGKIVWRGHPARVTDTMIEGWIN